MTAPTAPLLSVRDLRVHFFMDEGVVKAVDGISFDVYASQVFGIVGESGCGKSVAMKALLRIVEPPGRIVSGQILLSRSSGGSAGGPDGGVLDLASLDPNGRQMRDIRGAEIALIPQEPMAAFSPVHTVGNQIVEAIMLHQAVSEREAWKIAVQLARDVGIPAPEQRLNDYSWQLSGGLRQRAIIAMALSCNPRLLIADEPTTAVDVTTQAQVLRLLRELQARRHTAIIFITHDLGVIAQMADYVMVMYLGRVMEQGPVDNIFHAARHPYTQALLRSIPSIEGTPRVALPTISGSIPHPFNRPRGCPFHPRCPHFMPGTCDRHTPALRPAADGHLVSCFLYEAAEDRV
ncbi:MAG: ABC transporter ATP-binding protein [Armatimonadota bacterium]|nr:ABC transporter ATP-binding protein [Armatimonadota bacterium]